MKKQIKIQNRKIISGMLITVIIMFELLLGAMSAKAQTTGSNLYGITKDKNNVIIMVGANAALMAGSGTNFLNGVFDVTPTGYDFKDVVSSNTFATAVGTNGMVYYCDNTSGNPTSWKKIWIRKISGFQFCCRIEQTMEWS